MTFWGIEVKPGKPYVYPSGDESGRLHVSQATLGNGSSTKKSILQCKVEDKKPIYLCSLLPEKLETCALNLEFEEDDEVTFSIIGSHSVHLSGFFYRDDEDQDDIEHDFEADPCVGDIIVTDSEDEDDSSYNSEDEDDDDFDMYHPSPVPNSGVIIEEIVDEEKPTNENGLAKRAKKKKSGSDDKKKSNRQIVAKSGTCVSILESEDEDGFPVSVEHNESDLLKDQTKPKETNDDIIVERTHKNGDNVGENKLKRKISTVDQDGKPERDDTDVCGSTVQQPDAIAPGKEEVKKKKNKTQKIAEKVETTQEKGMPSSNVNEESPVADIGNDVKPSSENKKEKKKKNKQQASEEKLADKDGSILEKQEKKEVKSLQVRSFPNGFVIEEMGMGKPHGKRATRGKKVSVRYIGKLKKNDKIFDSNIGKSPFTFRLGIGQVIKGWDVGVDGMRVGDKRRLTIPPAMGYGAGGAPPAIPPNSWLVFDVELVDVK